MLLNALFSMVFAGAAIAMLSSFGGVARVQLQCPVGCSYSRCDAMQDLRLFMGLLLGAAVSCVASWQQEGRAHGDEEVEEEECFGRAREAQSGHGVSLVTRAFGRRVETALESLLAMKWACVASLGKQL
eukprot:CAMPEP_0117539682 /NCGR_PEP_ID=MMETSP0784-20121206/43111_1 /TAXON_ID=39447 /ORGANISM="" /LENGTH=128 /DNA_ID=CAMNT_0005336317 /DNA_START=206 /DNA_END=588 /DNA_ORIENTATION=-